MRERLRIFQAVQFAAQDREVRCAGGEMRIQAAPYWGARVLLGRFFYSSVRSDN